MQNGDPSVGGIRGPTKRTINHILPAANVPSTLGITPNYGAARTKIPQ